MARRARQKGRVLSPTAKSARAAVTRASQLGPIVPAEPAARDVDGFPLLGWSQVYVFRAGEVFHSIACAQVMAAYDADPERVIVIERATAGARRVCGTCNEEAV